MERTERVILTNLCMLRQGTKVLVEEKVGEDYRGIIFPGGHVEEHEPVVDSVIREMKEETGLTIESPRLCGLKDWINDDGSRYLVFLFTADKFTGTLTSSSEGRVSALTDVSYDLKDELLSLPWIWHMDSMMRIMADGAAAEVFLDVSNGWTPILK